MKILHVSTSDVDGGAARAAYRIHKGLTSIDVDSKMLVRTKLERDPTVLANKTPLAQLGSKLDALPLRQYPNRDSTMFSPQWFPDSVVSRVKQIDPDIVHLHWVCNGFLRIESLAKFQKPIVWTLHDMWPLTGGCHYTKGCDRYQEGCGSCPQLSSTKQRDLSFRVWQRKKRIWPKLNLTLAAPSHWLAACIKSSPLFEGFRIEVIPTGIDAKRYKPIDKQVARVALGLPVDKRLILFGAGSTSGDPRKGFRHLLAALQKLYTDEWFEQLELVVFGESSAGSRPTAFKTHYMDRLRDDISLALVYASADLFVAPSVQDNLPNTVIEALACGTPCLAFNIGGMPDMIEHQENGYLAEPFDIADLARGIEWTLADMTRHHRLSLSAHEKARKAFCLEERARQYSTLYSNLLQPTA